MRKKIKILRKKISLVKRNIFIINYYKNQKINENLILLESKNGKELGSNIFYLIKELSNKKYKNFKIVLSVRKENSSKIETIFLKYGINNVKFVEIGSVKYFKYLYSAKYLFNDTSFPSSFIKKESQVYLNTWHGTPLKKLGKDVPKRAYALGNIQKNFLMADYLLYPNKFMEERMLTAFMLKNISSAKIMNAGYPRNSIFLNAKEKKHLKHELGLQDMEIIIYMPTWRGTINIANIKGQEIKTQIEQLKNYLFKIDKLLRDDQLFYVKLHPFVSVELDYSEYDHVRSLSTEYDTYELLNMADCLVTDYSSVLFDFAVSKKKIILFAYDEQEYSENHGMYLELKDLPFAKVYNVRDLIEEINSKNLLDYTDFINKFCTYDEANASKHICEYLIFNKNSENVKIKNITHDKKEKVLIYGGSLAKNGITSSLISLLENIDLNKRNYFLSFRSQTAKRHSLTLNDISKKIDYIPMMGSDDFNFIETVAFLLFNKLNISNSFTKKYLDIAYKRNLSKYFYNVNFDKVIHFTGYEKNITALFQRSDSEKVIFAHNDLKKEIKTKGNQHFLTLHEAYNNYDKVAIVSNDIRKPIAEIKGNGSNIVVVENFIDYKTILKKSKEELVFDEQTISNMELDKLNQILNSDALKFINIGRFSHEKGHYRLLNVFNKFYKKENNSYLIIIGGYGKLYKRTLEYYRNLECANNVIIIRYLSNPFNILKHCDLFILSSYYEGLGLVILEADILGVKAISTNVSGPKTFMKKYGGYLVENSENGLYEGIQSYIEGKVNLLNINYEKYNANIVDHFESLFEK